MPLFLFLIFSGFPCENFPIWIQTDISYNYPQVEFVCEVCRESPYKFDRAGSLGLYDNFLQQLIHHFKYQKQLGVLSDIDCLLEKYFSEYVKEYSALTVSPIPRHFNKMRERV